MDAMQAFVAQYMALAEGSPGRKVIEQRYGAANIRRLQARFEEEQASKKWIDESTTACPRCEVNVEKSMGCNHVSVPSIILSSVRL